MKKAGTLGLAVGAVAIGTMAIATPAMAAAPAVHVTPNTGLTNNKVVTVKISGFTAGSKVYVLQCSKKIATAGDATKYCNTKNLKTITASSTGGGTTKFTVKTGAIGSAGKCVSKSTCFIGGATATGTGGFASIKFK